MKCREFVRDEVYTCSENASVGEVAEQMRRRGIGFVPVCDGQGRVCATVTDRDLCIDVLGTGRGAATCISEVMRPGIVSCRLDEDLSDAERRMAHNQVSRIVVLDDDDRAVAVISQQDLALAEPDPFRTHKVFSALHAPSPTISLAL